MAYSGKYRPSYPKKYKGDPTNIIYRSLWELKFMKYCDLNENILEWGSEEIIIPYRSPVDNRYHRYFPDFYIKARTSTGVKRYIIEIKPQNQVDEPKVQKKRTKKYINEVVTYAVNQAKWSAAREYCADKQWEFKILTEKDLRI
jgi:hypothetical protein